MAISLNNKRARTSSIPLPINSSSSSITYKPKPGSAFSILVKHVTIQSIPQVLLNSAIFPYLNTEETIKVQFTCKKFYHAAISAPLYQYEVVGFSNTQHKQFINISHISATYISHITASYRFYKLAFGNLDNKWTQDNIGYFYRHPINTLIVIGAQPNTIASLQGFSDLQNLTIDLQNLNLGESLASPLTLTSTMVPKLRSLSLLSCIHFNINLPDLEDLTVNDITVATDFATRSLYVPRLISLNITSYVFYNRSWISLWDNFALACTTIENLSLWYPTTTNKTAYLIPPFAFFPKLTSLKITALEQLDFFFSDYFKTVPSKLNYLKLDNFSLIEADRGLPSPSLNSTTALTPMISLTSLTSFCLSNCKITRGATFIPQVFPELLSFQIEASPRKKKTLPLFSRPTLPSTLTRLSISGLSCTYKFLKKLNSTLPNLEIFAFSPPNPAKTPLIPLIPPPSLRTLEIICNPIQDVVRDPENTDTLVIVSKVGRAKKQKKQFLKIPEKQLSKLTLTKIHYGIASRF